MNQRVFVRICLSFVFLILAGLFNACKLTNENATTNPLTTSSLEETILMPRMNIFTSNVAINSNEEYTDCLITLLSNDDSMTINQAQAGIRLRGHSTSNFDKKPYRIRFQDKTQPLGLGSGPSRSWVLLAEYMDISMLRNYISYKLSNQLLRNSFSSEAELIEVYLDGIYKGVYLLAEQTQVGSNRVNIDESGVEDPLILDTGFLLELEADSTRRTAEGAHMVDWFEVPGYTNMSVDFGWWNMTEYALAYELAFYNIKSDAKALAQIQFIQNYMVSVYDAIYTDKTFDAVNEVVDIESAVDMYLLQLISNDMDYNYSSNYVYKDAGKKLVFGPPWDHDLAYGNHYQNKISTSLHIYHLLYQLSTYEWFQSMVIQRWNDINLANINLIGNTKALITSTSNQYQSIFNNNYTLWESTRRDDGWHGIYIKYVSQSLAALQLGYWIDARVLFINDMFQDWEED